MLAYETRLLATCARPRLPHVECAVILAMRDRPPRWDARLHTLCAKTYVQLNAGYKSGLKPAWVVDSARDIVDAYRHACATFRDGNVLILEDDAQLMDDATTRADWSEVDRFLASSSSFDLYSLGCFGSIVPSATHGPSHYRVLTELPCVPQFAMAQAVVWTPRARELLRAADGRAIAHIDVHFMTRFPLVYTYHRPLVVQTFPATTNQAAWCVFCRRELAVVDKVLMRAFLAYLRAMGLHERTTGWRAVYEVNKLLPLVYLVCVSVLATTIARRAWK